MQPLPERTRWWNGLKQVITVKALALAGGIVATMLFVAAFSLPDGRLHVTLVDVGDGTVTLIETPSGRTILVDAGGSGRALSAALGDALPFWERRIDLVILTRPTQAHFSGLPPILTRYDIDAVMTNGVQGDSDAWQSLWSTLSAQNVPEVVALPGMKVVVGDGVVLTVLQTQIGQPAEGDAGEPVSLMLTYMDSRLLLPGDLSQAGQVSLMNSALLQSTALYVPDIALIGNREFVSAASPQVIIIPDGNIDISVPTYSMAETGTIHLITDGHRLWITTAR
jgi:competence protein ComEC